MISSEGEEEAAKLITSAVFICLVVVSGLTLNVTGIVTILKTSNTCKLFNYLIICLLVFDSWFLITAPFFFFGLKHAFFGCEYCAWLVPYWTVPCGHMAIFCTVMMTVAISHERYIAIKDPIYHNASLKTDEQRRKRLLLYLIPILIMSATFNIPRFFDFQVITNSTSGTIELNLTEQACDEYYIIFYENISGTVLTGFLPAFLLIFYSCKTYTALKVHNYSRKISGLDELKMLAQTARMQEEKMARVMKGLVLTYLVCHSPRMVLYCYNGIKMTRRCDHKDSGFPLDAYGIANHVSVFMCLVNSSIGTLLYCAMNAEFRKQLFINVCHCFGNTAART